VGAYAHSKGRRSLLKGTFSRMLLVDMGKGEEGGAGSIEPEIAGGEGGIGIVLASKENAKRRRRTRLLTIEGKKRCLLDFGTLRKEDGKKNFGDIKDHWGEKKDRSRVRRKRKKGKGLS